MRKFIPIPTNILDESDDFALLEAVFYHLLKLFDDEIPEPSVFDANVTIPDAAKVAWYLWQFGVEVTSSGIPDFLLNHCVDAHQIINIHDALERIKADELLVLLEAAIPLASEMSKASGKFSAFPHSEWLDQFQRNPLWSNFDCITERSLSLTDPQFFLRVASYVRLHRTELQTS